MSDEIDLVKEIERLRSIPQMVASRIVDGETHLKAFEEITGIKPDDSIGTIIDAIVYRVAHEIDDEQRKNQCP